MKLTIRRGMTMAAAVTAALLLGGCGGGGDDGAPAVSAAAAKPGLGAVQDLPPYLGPGPWTANVKFNNSITWLPNIDNSLATTNPSLSQLLRILVPDASVNHYIDFMVAGGGGYSSTVQGSSIYSLPTGFDPYTYVTTIDSFAVSNVSFYCYAGIRSLAFDVTLNITQLQQGNGFPAVTATGSRQISMTYLVPDGLVCGE